MLKDVIKDDFQLLALELNTEKNDKMSVYELNQTINNSGKFKEDPNAVNKLTTSIIETPKAEDSKLIELEKLRLEISKNELKLARICAVCKSKNEGNIGQKVENAISIDNIIKSINTLKIKSSE